MGIKINKKKFKVKKNKMPSIYGNGLPKVKKVNKPSWKSKTAFQSTFTVNNKPRIISPSTQYLSSTQGLLPYSKGPTTYTSSLRPKNLKRVNNKYLGAPQGYFNFAKKYKRSNNFGNLSHSKLPSTIPVFRPVPQEYPSIEITLPSSNVQYENPIIQMSDEVGANINGLV